MGRPEKKIEWEKLDLYLKAGSTQKKICLSFNVDPETLNRHIKNKYGKNFSDYSASLRSTGEMLIEAVQFQKAMSGNISMLMWLGKVRLGQKEPENIIAAANQPFIDQSHTIMRLEHEIFELKEQVNANKPQTE